MFFGGALSFGGDGGLSPGEDEKDAARTASERKMNRGSKRIVSVAAYCISLRGRVSTGNLRQLRLIDYDFGNKWLDLGDGQTCLYQRLELLNRSLWVS